MATCAPLIACLACGEANLEQVLDLGLQPLANNFLTEIREQENYPLGLNYCHSCTHLQLTHNVQRSSLFDNYLYVSGTSKTLRDDFANFAREIHQRWGAQRILDIACNDGSQLDEFKKLGWKTLGIDPARNILDSSIKNHAVICDYLKVEYAEFLEADIALAQNVLAHTDDPAQLMKTALEIAEILYVQTSQALMVQNGEFDTIYHEHLSFFSELSFWTLAQRTSTFLKQISLRNIHGTSFLFEVSNVGPAIEKPSGPTPEEAREFGLRSRNTIDKLDQVLSSERSSGSLLIGYGASAKGMTVLNALETNLDFLIDDSPLKQGRYTPGRNVPVVPVTFLNDLTVPVTFVMTAWNFEKEIRAKIEDHYNGTAHYIKYFPDVVIS